MKIEIPEGKEILVFTGPESSGKTTCAERIAREHQLPFVGEYAREYLTANGPGYIFEDIQKIATAQIKEEKIAHQNHDMIICDTDLVTLEIWAQEVYNKTLGLVDDLKDKKHYFLCRPDIPWESDPLRENPLDRDRLFKIYLQYLIELKVSHTILGAKERNELSF